MKALLAHYGLTLEDLSSFFLLLSMMKNDEELSTPVGRIHKATEDCFRLLVDEKTITTLTREFQEEFFEVRDNVLFDFEAENVN